MTDETNKIIQELLQKSHRFLAEDEVLDAVISANLSLFEANIVVDTLTNKGIYISDNIQEALNQLKNKKIKNEKTDLSRKSPINATTFSMLNIPVGSELTFLKDKRIVAITLDEINKIRLKDGSLEGSISKIAQILAVKFGFTDVARQGPRWWVYRGKTLLSIREQLDDE